MASLDKKQLAFLDLLNDPTKERERIDTIARSAGVTTKAVIELFRNSAFVAAQALAQATLASSLPAVVGDIAAKSVDSEVACPACSGQGHYANGDPCSTCNTAGKVFRGSDLDRQKLVLEATGVIKKQPGVAIQNNQSVAVMHPSNFFSKYVKDSDAAAYDVEVIEPSNGQSTD